MMRVLLIDNYDSFTWNVADQLHRVGATVSVVRNDAATQDQLLATRPDAIVLSPGPGGPSSAGVCIDLVLAAIEQGLPLLGICLGMQCIAEAAGGSVRRIDGPIVHGAASPVVHDGAGVFAGLPARFDAGRYHSLVVDEATLPVALVATAHTTCGVLMGIRHQTAPVEGIQFHPESILTSCGDAMLSSFLARAARVEAA